MKTCIITSLKSRVLLVEPLKFAFEYVITDKVNVSDGKGERMTILSRARQKQENESLEDYMKDAVTIHQELGKWKLLSTLREISDSDCEGLVHSDNEYGVVLFQNYRTTSMQYFDEQLTAKESFLSALKAEGLHLNGNPNKKSYFNPEEFIQEEYEIFMEAEQNVFSENTLIFVEQ